MKNRIAAGTLGLLSLPALHAATTTTPYVSSFDTDALGAPATPLAVSGSNGTAGSTIAEISPGDHVLRQTASATSNLTTGAAGNTTASAQFTNLGGATNQSFRISTTFRIDVNSLTNNNGSTFNVSIGLLGNNTNLGSGNRYQAVYTVTSSGGNQPTGSFTLLETGGTGAAGGVTANNGTFFSNGTVQAGVRAAGTLAPTGAGVSASDLYTMTIEGTYDTLGALTLTGALTRGGTAGGTLSLSMTDISAQTGNHFGVRTAINAVGTASNNAVGTLQTSFETLEVASIPEPGSMALGLLGLAGMAALRRRKV